MTEIITMTGIPGTAEMSSGYYIECLLVNQLIQIVGKEVMLESYFSNKGTIEIEKNLNSIINDKNGAQILFRRIEDNFYLRNIDCNQSILPNIQKTLIKYYKQKIIDGINNSKISNQEVQESMFVFENMLITPEKLIQLKKDPEKYPELEEIISEFEEFKNIIIYKDENVLVNDSEIKVQK